MFISSKRNTLLFAALAAAFGTASSAEFSVEGKLTARAANGTGATVTCNGVKIDVPGTATVSSPTHDIGIAGLLSEVVLPGRTEQGFLGGTCIIEGENSGMTNTAASVYVEPAENVIVGEVSQSIIDRSANPVPGPRPFKIRDVEIVPLEATQTAGLIVAKKPRNEVGVEINLDTVTEGDLSSAEGYVGNDGKMYAYVIETTGGSGDPANNVLAQGTVQRADLRTINANTFQYKLEVRGGCTFPYGGANQTLEMQMASGKNSDGTTRWISAANTGTNPTVNGMAAVTCTATVDVPGGGTYRYRNDNFRATAVPTAVRVRTRNGAAPGDPAQPGAWSEGEAGAPLAIR